MHKLVHRLAVAQQLPTPDWPTRNLAATNHRLRYASLVAPHLATPPVTLTSIRASGKVTLMSHNRIARLWHDCRLSVTDV